MKRLKNSLTWFFYHFLGFGNTCFAIYYNCFWCEKKAERSGNMEKKHRSRIGRACYPVIREKHFPRLYNLMFTYLLSVQARCSSVPSSISLYGILYIYIYI